MDIFYWKQLPRHLCFFIRSIPFPRPKKTWNFHGGATWTSMRLERGGGIEFGAVFQHPTRSAELYTRSPCIHVSAFSKGWKWLKSCLWMRHQTTKQKETQERKQHFPQRTVNFSQFMSSPNFLFVSPLHSMYIYCYFSQHLTELVAIRNMIQIGWHVPHIYIFLRRKNGEKIGLPVYPSLNPAIIRICNKESKTLVIHIGILFACKNRGGKQKLTTKWSSNIVGEANDHFVECFHRRKILPATYLVPLGVWLGKGWIIFHSLKNHVYLNSKHLLVLPEVPRPLPEKPTCKKTHWRQI